MEVVVGVRMKIFFQQNWWGGAGVQECDGDDRHAAGVGAVKATRMGDSFFFLLLLLLLYILVLLVEVVEVVMREWWWWSTK